MSQFSQTCQIFELNRRKIEVLGKDHPDSKFIIQQEELKTKAYNNYTLRVNKNMGAKMKYRKNKYTGKIPFQLVNQFPDLQLFVQYYSKNYFHPWIDSCCYVVTIQKVVDNHLSEEKYNQ